MVLGGLGRRGGGAPLTLLPAVQSWPELNQIPSADQSAASSTFADSKITEGDLPPSSRVTFFRLDSAAAMDIRLPVMTEPVKAT
jgi:hypothetical protein